MQSNAQINSVLRLLDATKTNKKWYDDRGLVAGYHSLDVAGQTLKGQRNPKTRLEKINYDFTNKRVLDIGCSNGGILHCLADVISCGVGVDYNIKCINAANNLKAINNSNSLHFYCLDLDKDDFTIIKDFSFNQSIDVCFFLNISMWVKKWKEVFLYCSELTDTMIFESHGSDVRRNCQLEFVKTIYKSVQLVSSGSEDDSTYGSRDMYICSERRSDNDFFIGEINESSFRELYRKSFSAEVENTVIFHPGTQGTFVADVDDQYVVKVMRKGGNYKNLLDEKEVLDYMRGRVPVNLPEFFFSESMLNVIRYKKIRGNLLSSRNYQALSEEKKWSFARQLCDILSGFHNTSVSDIVDHGFNLKVVTDVSPDLIKLHLADVDNKWIKRILPYALRRHELFKSSAADNVVGHFDLHGSNIIVSEDFEKINGIIDFGEFAVGDRHMDLSKLYLISPCLAEKVFSLYQNKNGRTLDILLIQNLMTIFYLDLLARFKVRSDLDSYSAWLKVFEEWCSYLNKSAYFSRQKDIFDGAVISDGWRKWLIEAIVTGCEVSAIEAELEKHGFSTEAIGKEIESAKISPYLNYTKDLYCRYKKRDWLLDVLDKVSSIDPRYSSAVEKIPFPEFNIFVERYYSKNLPVVLTGGAKRWAALKKWNPDYFCEKFGECEIEVQHKRESNPNYERDSRSHKKILKMSEFVKMVTDVESSNDFYMTANNAAKNMKQLDSLFEDVADFGDGYRELNTLHSNNLLWFGPKGTYTPMHYDLINNMLVQVLGRKKVTLIPALQSPFMYNDISVYSAADFSLRDEDKFPLLKNVSPIEIELHPGDALFIPVGWWHSVESLDVSISVTFNNFNVENIYFSL